jgi:hypothetical protein
MKKLDAERGNTDCGVTTERVIEKKVRSRDQCHTIWATVEWEGDRDGRQRQSLSEIGCVRLAGTRDQFLEWCRQPEDSCRPFGVGR